MGTTISAPVGVDHLAIARHYAAQPDKWPFAPRFDPTGRWYHRLDTRPDWEAWLLTWLPGQGTELHDHGDSAGGFAIVDGELVEHTVGGALAQTFATGTGRSFPGGHIHRIVNAGDRPAVSVHVYGPALTSMTRYRLEHGSLVVTAVDRAGAQW